MGHTYAYARKNLDENGYLWRLCFVFSKVYVPFGSGQRDKLTFHNTIIKLSWDKLSFFWDKAGQTTGSIFQPFVSTQVLCPALLTARRSSGAPTVWIPAPYPSGYGKSGQAPWALAGFVRLAPPCSATIRLPDVALKMHHKRRLPHWSHACPSSQDSVIAIVYPLFLHVKA